MTLEGNCANRLTTIAHLLETILAEAHNLGFPGTSEGVKKSLEGQNSFTQSTGADWCRPPLDQ